MYYSPKNKQSGFTLVELLIATTIGLIILVALSSTFFAQHKAYDVQEQIVEMVQTARAAMDMMTREIRMAGYDPRDTANATITDADAGSITFTQDLDGDGNLMDGSKWDTNERIRYNLYTSDGIQKIGWRTGSDRAVTQPVAEHVQSLEFKYWDDSVIKYNEITMLSRPVANPANIRVIQITITARTTKPDADYSANSGYRTRTLTSLITLRNPL